MAEEELLQALNFCFEYMEMYHVELVSLDNQQHTAVWDAAKHLIKYNYLSGASPMIRLILNNRERQPQ